MKKKLSVGLAVGVMMLGMAVVASATPIQWAVADGGNGHWYELVAGPSWDDAESQSVASGGHLVTINNAAENDWVSNTFHTPTINFYIGLNDIAQEGTFTWVSGEISTYTNWIGGEPNNGGWTGIPEDVVVTNWDYPGGWNDVPRNVGMNGLAEYESAPVPGPATILLMGTGVAGLIGARRKKKK